VTAQETDFFASLIGNAHLQFRDPKSSELHHRLLIGEKEWTTIGEINDCSSGCRRQRKKLLILGLAASSAWRART